MSGYADGFKRGTNIHQRTRMARVADFQAAELDVAISLHGTRDAKCAAGDHAVRVADPKQVTYLAYGKRVEPGTRYCGWCSAILPAEGAAQ
jgi:hypothetical protein